MTNTLPALADDNRLVMENLRFISELKGFDTLLPSDRVASDWNILNKFDDFSKTRLHAANIPSYEAGLSWDGKDAHYPPVTVQLYDDYTRTGFIGVSAGTEYGGSHMLAPFLEGWNIMFCKHNPQFWCKEGLTVSSAKALEYAIGIETDEKKKAVLENILRKMIAGEYTGAMVMTEPKGGSNLGSEMETAAILRENGHAEVKGLKNFITGVSTGGTSAKNVMSLVFSVTQNAQGEILPDKNKKPQLTVTLVPKYKLDEQGNTIEPREENGITISEPYRKPGIEPQILTAVEFKKSDGIILGQPGSGMDVILQVMNPARLKVAAQGVAAAQEAFERSADFATRRGVDTRHGKPIITHPPIRDRLKLMRSYAELGTSLIMEVGMNLELSKGTGNLSPEECKAMAILVELQTPMVKGYLTERGKEAARLAVDVMAATGFTSIEIPKLCGDIGPSTFYEGSNQMMARAIAMRQALMKIPDASGKPGKTAMQYFIEQAESVIARHQADPELTKVVEPLSAGLDKLIEATQWLQEKAAKTKTDRQAEHELLAASESYMMLLGDVSMAVEGVKIAAKAHEKLNAGGTLPPEEKAFYETKIDTATYFNNAVLATNASRYVEEMKTKGTVLDITPDLERMVQLQREAHQDELREAGAMTLQKVRAKGAPYDYRSPQMITAA